MDWGTTTEFALILLLILLNGFFAAAEIAVLTARRGRLEQFSESGDRGARAALKLSADADSFLPTVQVGITLVGTFAAAFGGASMAKRVSDLIDHSGIPWLMQRSDALGLGVVTLVIAFLSLILGELVPKRVALQNAEFMARWVALPMVLLQKMTRPVVWCLRMCTKGALRMLGQRTDIQEQVSVEDIQHLIDAGHEAGVIHEAEQQMAIGALRLRERTIVEILRPRIEIDALDIDTPSEEVIGAIAMSGFSRVPVCEGDIDHIVGFVYIKDVFLQQYLGRPIDLRRMIRTPLFVPQTLTVSRLLELFQEQKTQLAIVLDEYGGTEGMVTMEDVIELLLGDVHDEHRQDREEAFVRREDGSLLVDGAVTLWELQEFLDISRWPTPPPKGIGTVAGLVHTLLKRLPHTGDVTEWNNLRIEIVDMDGPRIDRLLIQPLGSEEPTEVIESPTA